MWVELCCGKLWVRILDKDMIEGFFKVYDGDVSGICGGFNRIW